MNNAYYTYKQFVDKDNNLEYTNDNKKFYVKEKVNGSITLELYQNTAENNRVNKTNYINLVNTIYGVIREESSITDVSLTIEYDKFIDFNYIYIKEFNRYYFVNDVTMVRYNLYNLSLSVDVLMTYRWDIIDLRAFVDRNEFEYNPNVVDKNRVIELGYDIQVDNVSNELFNVSSGEYVVVGLLLGLEASEEE